MVQATQIRQTALAQMQLAPHVEEGTQLQTPDGAVAEFAAWLIQEPPPASAQDDENAELFGLLGVR
jgi:hypothetical protein